MDGEFFEIAKVRQFGIIYVHNRPEVLRLLLAKKISPQLDLRLPDGVNVAELRDYLSAFVLENEDMEFTLVEHLLHIFHI